MNIDTTSQAYQNILNSLVILRNQLNNNYMPLLLRMTPEQLKQLYLRDELFREAVKLARDLHKLANVKDIYL